MMLRTPTGAWLVLAISSLLLTACSGPTGAPAVTAQAEKSAAPSAANRPSGSLTEPSTPAGSPGTPASTPAVVLDQAWADAQLVDASTGDSFRISDYAGSVIVVETMAIWCSSCLTQQRDVMSALASLPVDRVVYVVLDVDPNEDAAGLAAYREKHGFQGRYAVASKDVARALAAEFGDQFLNPPSTPMLVIGTDGTVTLTEFGHKNPDEIVALAKANGA